MKPGDFDGKLAQMINEPQTDMQTDLDMHDQANKIEYDREAVRKAEFVSGPHFWNAKDGTPYVTLMFDVEVSNVEPGSGEPWLPEGAWESAWADPEKTSD